MTLLRAFCFALLIPQTSLAQRPDSIRSQVSGTGQVTVRLVPTRAVVHLLIEATAPTAGEAVTRAGLSSAGVLDTLQRIGGAEELTVVQYGVVPTPMQYGGGGGGPPNTFTSRSAVRFVAALSRVQSLTAAAYARGASSSAAPQFQHEELDDVVLRAVEEATAKAKQRAETIARGLGGRLGQLMHVSSAPSYGGVDYQMQYFPAPNMYDQQSRPLPEIRQVVQVTGTWVFVPR